MSTMISSQGVVLATAMAVSGTVLLLALRLQKSTQFPVDRNNRIVLRSCMSSVGKNKEKKKKKKRVHFAEDVVDPVGYSEEFRKKHGLIVSNNSSSSSASQKFKKSGGKVVKGMPANRLALYNGILRDRVHHRLAYSF